MVSSKKELTFTKKVMSISFLDVELYLKNCCEGFLSKDYSIAMVSEQIMEMCLWDTHIPFVDGMRALDVFEFSEEEQLGFALLCDHIFQEGVTPIDYAWYSKHPDYGRIQKGKEGLLSRSIIRRAGNNSDNPERTENQKEKYLPTQRAFGKLFKGRSDLLSLEALSKQAEIIMASTIRKKELFFNEMNKEDIERLYYLMNPERFFTIMERLRARGRKESVTCLLYGAPGTGKTELAKQLALATGRDLVIADAAKLYASWHGDTEKNVKELFETYQYVQSISANAPILLFNEADGLLSKRTDVMRQAVDKIENRIQNLFLQALEDFEGIFIATTNLTDNMDSAFERRFLYKINFQNPDPDTRAKIWHAMIPDLGQAEAIILASQYEFTGGQIDNVAKKRDIDEALFGEEPTLEQMLNYCDNELIATSGEKSHEKVDFNKAFFGHGGTLS